jgi:hypothetical protein
MLSLQTRYRKAQRRQRSQMLDEFVATTGYHRKYAIALLRGKVERVEPSKRKPRRRTYTDLDRKVLRRLADLFDQIGSKRLRAAWDATLPQLRANGFLDVSGEVYRHLEQMSPATMDRLRVGDPQRLGQGRSLTKPGTLLKTQIPIRTYADWNDQRPGFLEVDLVDHSGGLAQGDFAQTLNMTDVCTGWTEMQAVPNKAQVHVFAAIQVVRARLPFALLGIDSDNGGEFINAELWRYCRRERITFTRGRSGRKNDNAYVEQKNWSVVRRLTGYGRYDSPPQVKLLNQLYGVYRLYVNFFLPVVKLQSKVRMAGRTKKVYDAPQTPYQRLLASGRLSVGQAQVLIKQYERLDVVQLKQQIDALLTQLKPSPLR